jgi:uncharacterized protein (TIGR02145 family)
MVQYLNGAGNNNTWDPVPTGSVTGICPSGWHIPTDGEWNKLTDYLGGTGIAGGKMKEAGTNHWYSPNEGATNSSGFTALPGGVRDIYGSLYSRGYTAFFRSASEFSATYAWIRYLDYYSEYLAWWTQDKPSGSSVRCLKDCEPLSSPASGSNEPSPTQIIWNWNTVAGATGYKWNTSNDYATATEMGTDTTKAETGLFCGITYERYVWAYNSCEPSAPVVLTQATLACPANCQPLTDSRDGKTYGTVLIGDQCWMAQNLNIGVRIDASGDQAGNGIVEKYCYNNDPDACNVYGGLYQWNEMMNYTSSSILNPSERKGICPNGWHLPSDGEWTQLTTFLGGESVAGGEMKETGTIHWDDQNTGATNSSGFTALPGGYCDNYGYFATPGYSARFWSTSEYSVTSASIRNLYSWNDYVGLSFWDKLYGFSVRCLKDTCVDYSSVGISISVTANPVCYGSGVIFTATPTYGGTAPVYQWKVNGSDAGANSETFAYVPVNNDVVTCELTSSALCVSGTPAPVVSNAITMVVSETIPPVPETGIHVPSAYQITWNWSISEGASGYKWNSVNDYNTAEDVGNVTSKTANGLDCGSSYNCFVWSYNGCGASAPVVLTQATVDCPANCQPLTDSRDGKTYHTVLIGDQCWMKENLNVGVRIDGYQDQADNSITEKYCNGDLESNCDVFGGLYQWGEMVQYLNGAGNNSSWDPVPAGSVAGICPSGWHIPADDEWNTLANYLGGSTVAGGKMKEAGTSHWYIPNEGATNSSGFKALPGGARYYSGGFYDLVYEAYFWSSTEFSAANASLRLLGYYTASMYQFSKDKPYGSSVRCLKDCEPLSSPASGSNEPSPTQIIWNWNTVAGATGYKWNTSNDYATATDMGTATAKTETDLFCGMTYERYVWAYNSCGFSAAVVLTQPTAACPASCQPLTDARDGKTYGTVLIGDQCWMAQNLNAGVRIDGSLDQVNNGIVEKYCYDDDPVNCQVYGGLYRWNEMMQFAAKARVQGICPSGWHIPSNTEWGELTIFLGGENIAGGKLKETGTTHWISPNTGATNESGFTGLPGGSREDDGSFNAKGISGILWTSDVWPTAYEMMYGNTVFHGFGLMQGTERLGFSVRCLKDCEPLSSPASGSNEPSPTQIIWNWNTVPGATGYKWNTANDYETAVDMFNVTTSLETGLTCNTAYTRYVWAYSACGNSAATTLTQTTSMNPAAHVSIVASGNPVCSGTSVTFTASPENEGLSPLYQWKNKEIDLDGATDAVYAYTPVDNDRLTCQLTSSVPCSPGNPATSNEITMTVHNAPDAAGVISGPATVVQGQTDVHYSVPEIPNATGYNWATPSGTTITDGANTHSITVSFASDASSGMMRVTGTNACGSGTASPDLNITVNIPATLTIGTEIVTGVKCYNAEQTITVAGGDNTFTVASGGRARMIAGMNILYLKGTTVQEGGYMRGNINSGDGYCISRAPAMVSSPTGTEETNSPLMQGSSFFRIYPNPTSGTFTLELSKDISESSLMKIEIYGMRGEKLLNKQLAGARKHELSLQGKPAGIYFIRVLNGEISGSVKIIKQ